MLTSLHCACDDSFEAFAFLQQIATASGIKRSMTLRGLMQHRHLRSVQSSFSVGKATAKAHSFYGTLQCLALCPLYLSNEKEKLTSPCISGIL